MPNGFLVVFDHENRVAQVAQLFQSLYQAIVVALVQTNGGLVDTYKTPRRRDPICVARRMWCPSPPESVVALRSSKR